MAEHCIKNLGIKYDPEFIAEMKENYIYTQP